ncbi:NUDIX hydrolase [Lederbergia wuyishanensis]|uniref:ADP-ribose pyrophosphatase YjhB (NUDIX family) n=1 Tax=Lederbergia wuyishanensis TaxID=1347903 RepID=A0ABU0D8W6_9BACI|nr:NUDIX hydrolase [Lederbergia wuyishanensis]MCJ8007616.1 NUDIX hydrolase [Lederbergia wuyishanensis]MDQ0344800.1 ADP-ribose pyrophosphatase YjhB (NUDIX family) [Lederbergia wuyishanensis]
MGYVEDLRKLIGTRPVILVGSVVIVINESNKVLLQQRSYPYGVWGLPGGLMELTESTEDCARREVFEETGLVIGDLELLSVSSGPQNFIKAQNGDEFYVVTITYITREILEGGLKVDGAESLSLDYFDLNNLPENMVGGHRKAIDKYVNTISENLDSR